jgi:3-oxoacyl-[acyl-carrier-protein] synthase-1
MAVYIISDNVISPLGVTTQQNFDKVRNGETGIKLCKNILYAEKSIYASCIQNDDLGAKVHSRFENLCVRSITEALSHTVLNGSEKDTIFILSTTKGNIGLIEKERFGNTIEQVSLDHSARVIASHFQAVNKPIVVSNACISGVLSIIIAKRLLESGKYKYAIVTGADMLSQFVASGFQSLMALSDEPCRPFDRDRKGINLGEGAATVIITSDKALADTNSIAVMGEGVTNDANHISGPSRTGQELAGAVVKAMHRSGIGAADLSFISAHGTATLYNDEMEAKAFDIAGLNEVPLHSLKGYFGHTLGAAGLIESIMAIHSLRNNCILASRNFDTSGVPKHININMQVAASDKSYALKTASGFGGCNAALVYSKILFNHIET